MIVRFALGLILLSVTACGFRPVHSDKTLSETPQNQVLALNQISVEVPMDNRLGQLYRIALEDVLHPGNDFSETQYIMKSTIIEELQPIIIERNSRITRYNMVLKAEYTLSSLIDGSIIHRGRRQRISSYNVADSDFATFVAQRDARETGVRKVAEMLALDMAKHLAP